MVQVENYLRSPNTYAAKTHAKQTPSHYKSWDKLRKKVEEKNYRFFLYFHSAYNIMVTSLYCEGYSLSELRKICIMAFLDLIIPSSKGNGAIYNIHFKI